MFGLTQAPASQPRNGIFGQIVGMTVSLSLSYATPYIPPWLVASLAIALSVSIMAKLGVVHPPGAASSVLFLQGHDWISMAYMIGCYLVAIASASYFNNLSTRRQYPTYWFPALDSYVRRVHETTTRQEAKARGKCEA